MSFGRGVDIGEEACLLDCEAREGFSMAPKAARASREEVAGELVAEVSLGLAVAVAVAVVLGIPNKANVVEVEGGYASACLWTTGEGWWCTESSDWRWKPGSV